jgi:hypothetical protein
MQKWIRDVTIEKYISHLKVGLNINKQTKIASIGSCFAREIRQYLLSHNYNYLLVERNKNPWLKVDPHYKPNEHGSAAWDRVFNTFTLRDIIRDSLRERESLDSRLFDTGSSVADLLRTRVVYPDKETAIADIDDHRKHSARVLISADILVVTLGLTEVWEYGDRVLPYLPDYIPKDRLAFKRSSYAENLNNLIETWDILKLINKNLKMLLTLSPIHMNATHRGDIDVFSASCASKSILRAAIDDFIQEDVYYFPSYEITTILCQELGIKPYRDGHHISEEAFAIVTRAFEGCVVC